MASPILLELARTVTWASSNLLRPWPDTYRYQQPYARDGFDEDSLKLSVLGYKDPPKPQKSTEPHSAIVPLTNSSNGATFSRSMRLSLAATCARSLMLFSLVVAGAAVGDASVTYDPAADFELGWTTQSNPNGVWSYGYSSGFANPKTLYDQTVQNGINGPNAQYWVSSTTDVGNSPAAEFNNGPAFADGNVRFLADEFILVAGIGGQYSDLVFTAPADGTYSITGPVSR